MFCIQCGCYNPDHAAFCGKCALQLKQPSGNPSSQLTEGATTSRSAQPLAAEYIPTVQQMPVASSYPVSQGTPPSSPPQPWDKALPKPMPIWALISGIVLVAILLIVLQLTGSDWAAGAMHVGIVAGILALLFLLITVIRTLQGTATKSNPTRLIRLISAGLVIMLL